MRENLLHFFLCLMEKQFSFVLPIKGILFSALNELKWQVCERIINQNTFQEVCQSLIFRIDFFVIATVSVWSFTVILQNYKCKHQTNFEENFNQNQRQKFYSQFTQNDIQCTLKQFLRRRLRKIQRNFIVDTSTHINTELYVPSHLVEEN